MEIDLSERFYEAQDYFFRSLSLKVLHLGDVATAYLTGVPSENLNPVHVNKNTYSIDAIIEQAHQLYGPERVPHLIAIPEEACNQQVRDSLIAQGYDAMEKSIGLAIQLDGYKEDQRKTCADGGNVVKANDTRLEEWIVPLIAAFESTRESASAYVTAHGEALRRGSAFYHLACIVGGTRFHPLHCLLMAPKLALTMWAHFHNLRARDMPHVLSPMHCLKQKKWAPWTAFSNHLLGVSLSMKNSALSH